MHSSMKKITINLEKMNPKDSREEAASNGQGSSAAADDQSGNHHSHTADADALNARFNEPPSDEIENIVQTNQEEEEQEECSTA